MAKQLNVSLLFNANTGQAKQQIQSLITELNKLGSIGENGFNTNQLTANVIEAKVAAKDLGNILQQSFNVDTGKLDLNKFNSSLKSSGKSLNDYGNQLANLGAKGNQAFLKISQSIVETEAPLRRSSGLLKEFGTTLANTARWQISSSVLHSFMGTIQSAYGYAKDLDKSLNNIRIVTGQNTEQMAEFAEKANRAAKALSTTTTDYTNASLIYYQQGLDDAEVQKRTDITIKMANAAGQSAEVVSEQLTAIWNNFDDGSKSLEYYADVMTALGAATASSTDEIAGGLEKFAAIGETIGLSYEYAASALTTITSNTRQSEEVVGTALKTIFARIQGLKMGETLEDGLDLNKYSEALQAVGISIFDSTGELRKMDSILDDMASRWEVMSKAQQAALAQTVAGTRQYTQLVALMENWNNGDNDSMMANLDTAYGASGSLQKQADIYAESWEASRDRVKSALEGIYDSLLNEDFFIDINDGLSSSLGVVEKLVDSLGGMSGTLAALGMVASKIFKNQFAEGINNALHNFRNFTGSSIHELQRLKEQAYESSKALLNSQLNAKPGGKDPAIEAQINNVERMHSMQKDLENALRGTNSAQEKIVKSTFETAENYSKAAEEAGKLATQAKNAADASNNNINNTYGKDARQKMESSSAISVGLAGEDLIAEAQSMANVAKEIGGAGEEIIWLKNAIQEYKNTLADLGPEAAQTIEGQRLLSEASEGVRVAMDRVNEAAELNSKIYEVYSNHIQQVAKEVVESEFKFQSLQENLKNVDITQATEEQLNSFRNSINTVVEEGLKLGLPLDEIEKGIKEFDIALENGEGVERRKELLKSVVDKLKEIKITAEQAESAIEKTATSRTHKTMRRRASDQVTTGSKEDRKSARDNASQDVNSALNRRSESFKKNIHAVRESEAATKSWTSAEEKAKKEAEELANKLEKAKQSVQDFGQGAATMAQGTMSATMGVQSLVSAWNTLQDPDMSAFEKILSITMSLSMGIPSLVSGFGNLKKGFTEVKNSLGGGLGPLLAYGLGLDEVAIAQARANREKQESIAVDGASATASGVSAAANAAEATATGLSAEAQEEENEEKAEGIALTIADVAATKLETIATGTGTAAKVAQKFVQDGLNSSLLTYIGLLASAAVAAAPYILAIAGIAAVTTGVVYALTAESRALEEAEEQERKSAESAQRVTEEISNINTQLNDIKSKTDAFQDLEKGTLEWYQALNEVNSMIETLIEKYPQLVEMGFITIDQNGMMGISDEGIDYITQENIKKQTTSNNISLRSQQNTLKTKTENNWDEFFGIGSDDFASEAAAKGMVEAYAVFGESMFNNASYMNGVLEVMKSAGTNTSYIEMAYTNEEILAWMNENKEQIKEQYSNVKKINDIDKKIIESRMAALGSNRSANEVMDLMGDYEGPTVAGKGNKKELTYINADGKPETFNMNQNKNYTDETMPQEIKDFISLQGEGAEYKGQEWGKLVLTIGDEEVKFSQDEVYDALKEFYGQDTFNAKLKETLETSLQTSLGNVSFGEDVTLDNLIALDNLQLGLKDSFEAIFPDEDAASLETKVNDTFNSIINAYGTSKDALDQLAEDTEFIDLAGPEFQEEVAKLQEGLADGTYSVQQFKDAIQELNAAAKIDTMDGFFKDAAEGMGLKAEDAKLMKDYAKHLMSIADESDELSDNLDENAEAAANLAVQITKMNKGIDTLADNFEDWRDVLDESSETSKEYSDAISGVRDALSDVLDVEGDFISNDFIKTHLEDIEKAATGDADAIDRLKAALADQIILDIKGVDSLNQLDTDLQTKIQSLKDYLAQNPIEVGATMDLEDMDTTSTDFINMCNDIVRSAGMTAEQANAYFDAMGFEATFETKQEPVVKEGRGTITRTESFGSKDIQMPDGSSFTIPAGYQTFTYPGDPYKYVDYVDVIAMETSPDGKEVPKINSITKKAGGSMNNYSSSNPGGKTPGSKSNSGGSKPKKADPTKKSDIVDRYKEINDELEDIEKKAEKAEKSLDNLYGKDQDVAIEDLLQAEKDKETALKKKKTEAYNNLQSDLNELNKAASAAGVSFKYDADGDIANYTEQMTNLWEKLRALETAAGAEWDENEQKQIEALKEKIETLKQAKEQYEETKRLFEEIGKELDDMKGKIALPYIMSDLVDIFRETDDILDDINDKISEIADEADRLTGAEKIKKLREMAKLEKERLKVLQDQKKINDQDVKDKASAMQDIAKRNDLSKFTFDENGNITNFDENIKILEDKYESYYNKFSKDGYISEAEQAALDALQEDIDQLQEYSEKYKEAVENGEDIDQEIKDAFYAYQDANAEALALELELGITINERDLRKIEYYLGKIEDDFYQMAEVAALMVGNNLEEGLEKSNGQFGIYLSNLKKYEESLANVEEAYKNQDISPEQYEQQLEKIADGIYENLENIQQLDKAMLHYYEDTLVAAGEELAKFTDHMEHSTEVLEHYQSIMETMGKTTDYNKLGVILKGQSETLKDQMSVAKETMNFYQSQRDEKKKLYDDAVAAENKELAETYKGEYEAALAEADKAESEYLESAQEYAQSLRDILENDLLKFAQDLENKLTGNTSFDQLSNSIIRAKSIQEEFLTTTNKIYETNKMINTAQQAIDKTTNSVAKSRLKQFISETNALQEKNKLSQYELNIQQAKYDLLLAEIALEEAQNAKSTVRLSRDKEGNFGYIYTADSSKIAEAEQKLADAQNKLYNIALDGANDYTDKYTQTLNEMYDTLADLQQQYLQGAFESEAEYNNAVTAAKEYYYEKLEQYSSLHAIALSTDSRVIEDAWSTQFNSMIYNTETWKSHVEQYVSDVKQSFINWKTLMDGLEEELGLSNLELAVKGITDESKALGTYIKETLIPALKEELLEVSNLTTAWGNHRKTLLELLTTYETLGTTIDGTLNKLQDPKGKDDGDPPVNPETPTTTTPTETPTTTTPTETPTTTTPEVPATTPPTYNHNQKTKQGVALAIWNGGYGWGVGADRTARLKKKGFDPSEINTLVNNTNPNGNWKKRYGITDLSKYSYSSFDTGGYTGEWGPNGKFALLHEKEIVLNKEDTQNLLLSMEVLNNIIKTIDLQTANAQIGNIKSSMHQNYLAELGTFEQSVHIEASFPGVSNRNEIEEAFNNLINQASQYANRK